MKIILSAIPGQDIYSYLAILQRDISLHLTGAQTSPHVYSVVVNGEQIGATTNDASWLAQWNTEVKVVETLRTHWQKQLNKPIMSASVARVGYVSRMSKSKLTSSLDIFGRTSETNPFLHLSVEEYGVMPVGVPFFSNELFTPMWASANAAKSIRGVACVTPLLKEAMTPFARDLDGYPLYDLDKWVQTTVRDAARYLGYINTAEECVERHRSAETLKNLKRAAKKSWKFTTLGHFLKLMGHS